MNSFAAASRRLLRANLPFVCKLPNNTRPTPIAQADEYSAFFSTYLLAYGRGDMGSFDTHVMILNFFLLSQPKAVVQLAVG